MLAGHILTLNFYSNPIDVMIESDKTVYLNWDHFRQMIEKDCEIPPHLVKHDAEGHGYVAFSYIIMKIKELTQGIDQALFADLVQKEFFGYIVRELAIIRDILPLIELEYAEYDAGIFEMGDKQYILSTKLERFGCPIHVPDDVPRFPAVIEVSMPKTQSYGPAREMATAFPLWLIELSSLPYILKKSREAKAYPQYGLIGSLLGTTEGDARPMSTYHSPGVVGTSRCEIDTSKLNKVVPLGDDMTWAGSGLTLKSEL